MGKISKLIFIVLLIVNAILIIICLSAMGVKDPALTKALFSLTGGLSGGAVIAAALGILHERNMEKKI